MLASNFRCYDLGGWFGRPECKKYGRPECKKYGRPAIWAEVPTAARARAGGIAARRVCTAPAATTPHGASVGVAAGAALRRLTRYTKFIYDIYMIRNNLKILETCTCALNIS